MNVPVTPLEVLAWILLVGVGLQVSSVLLVTTVWVTVWVLSRLEDRGRRR